MKKKICTILLCVVTVIMIFMGSKIYFEREAEIKISIIADFYKDFVSLEYEKLSVNPFRQDIIVKKVSLSSLFTNTKLYISEIIVTDFDYYSTTPKFADISVRGIMIEGKNGHKDLKRYGIDADIAYRYDEKKRLLSVNRFSIKENKLGKIDFRASFGNITLDNTWFLLLFFTYPSIVIHDASFYFENKSAMDLLYQYLGTVISSTPSETKLKLVDYVEQISNKILSEEKFDFFIKIKNFLDDPDKLLITISPEPPITVRELQQILFHQDFFKRLNLKAVD